LWIAVVPAGGVTATEIASRIKSVISRGTLFRLVTVPSIPRNAMGKVDRPRLVQQVRNLLRAAQQRKRENA
jgi:acyl-CoA synthetase (AMP-forming)/AMP-acid ligase II